MKPNISYHGMPPGIVLNGKIIRRSTNGGFIFCREDGTLYLSRLGFGKVQYIDREKLGVYLEKQDLQMLKKLGVLSLQEVREALVQAKKHAAEQNLRSDICRFLEYAKRLGIEAMAKGLLRKSK